uniref:AAA domain-containing protein n=1 Tax=Candidatus Kentrum sp. TUN TaxID=2126343 RepID=A0A451A9K1_9GAMM|nr:MAG: AAA domain-containing protein [Candidatus Kentron sp. TUN]VFK71964.1 MAG: AAA domain-containing protein [Candidatus Kentron sp. TUN]
MYKSIGWELGLPTERNRASAFRAIRTEITRLTLETGQRPVLIIDEAHHLRNEILEDLRLLTNYRMDSENRLCLLLVGLTELRRRLAMAVHESLAQRIVVRYHLTGLTREEVSEYLTHRLRLVGCELPLFEPPAIEAIFQDTQGRVRKINTLAHYALTSGAIDKAKTITAEHVRMAREEITP